MKIKQGGGRPAAYKDASGKRVPSVTTILGRFKDSGGLIRWAYTQGQRKERGEIDDLYDDRDKAANIGGLVHDIAEYTVAGDHDALAEVMTKVNALPADQQAMVRAGADAFTEWFDGSRIEIAEAETPLVSARYGFAGTFDALGRDQRGRLVLIDYKTSSGLYADYIVQLGAYSLLLQERGDVVENGHLLRFSKEFGNFAHHHITADMLRVGGEHFLALLDAYSSDATLKRMIK